MKSNLFYHLNAIKNNMTFIAQIVTDLEVKNLSKL